MQPFSEKMREQLLKTKKKNILAIFNTFNRWYENQEETQICFVDIEILSNSQTQYLHSRSKGL